MFKFFKKKEQDNTIKQPKFTNHFPKEYLEPKIPCSAEEYLNQIKRLYFVNKDDLTGNTYVKEIKKQEERIWQFTSNAKLPCSAMEYSLYKNFLLKKSEKDAKYFGYLEEQIFNKFGWLTEFKKRDNRLSSYNKPDEQFERQVCPYCGRTFKQHLKFATDEKHPCQEYCLIFNFINDKGSYDPHLLFMKIEWEIDPDKKAIMIEKENKFYERRRKIAENIKKENPSISDHDLLEEVCRRDKNESTTDSKKETEKKEEITNKESTIENVKKAPNKESVNSNKKETAAKESPVSEKKEPVKKETTSSKKSRPKKASPTIVIDENGNFVFE
jgi:hypothetical protein